MIVTINGIDTHYERIGHGPFVVMLHGWGCDWQIWYPVIQRLSAHYTLLIPDLPAFGSSSSPTQVWDSSDYVTWLRQFIEETIGGKSFSLMGHSFGGKVAALLAAQQPLTLQKLVLVDASGLPDPLPLHRQLQQTVLGLIPSVVKNSVPAKLKDHLLQATHSSTDHLHSSPQQRAILRAIVRENISNHIVNIARPTLIVWGDDDHDTPVSHAHRFAELIPGSRLEVMTTAGHFPFMEKPDEFLAIMQPFLAS